MRFILAVSMIAALMSQEGAPPASAPRVSGSVAAVAAIRGQAIDAATRGPLRNATVRASSERLKQAVSTVTDREGRFEFAGLSPGDYGLVVTKRNYIRQPFGRVRANDPPRPITVKSGELFDRADFIVSRGGVIAGTIIDEVGEPLDTVLVSILGYEYTPTGRRFRTVARSRPTNDLGEYRIAGLPGGHYFLAATLPNLADDGVLSARVLDRVAYAPTYYPDAASVALAERILVKPGDVVLGRSIAVKPVRILSVRGRAIAGTGEPLYGRRVAAFLEGVDLDPIRTSTVGEDGSFVLSGLPAGSYTLRVRDDLAETTGTIRLALSDVDVDGVELIATPPAIVRGRLRLAASPTAPPPPSSFRVVAIASEHHSDAGAEAVLARDFTFQLKSAAGRALLRVESRLPDWTLESVRINKVDVTDRGFEVPRSGILTGLEIVMTHASPSLVVEVVDEQGEPVTDTQVVVFSRDRSHWAYGSRYVALARVNTGNRFVARLPAGGYYAVAIHNTEPGEWYDPQFLASIVTSAVEVELAAVAPSNVRLSISQ